MTEMSDYHINLFWSGEDECWIADIPDLKFCSAHGETPDEALQEVMIGVASAGVREVISGRGNYR